MPFFIRQEDKMIHWIKEEKPEEFAVVCLYSHDVDGINEPSCNCSPEQQDNCAADI